jgi:hypothetical protein
MVLIVGNDQLMARARLLASRALVREWANAAKFTRECPAFRRTEHERRFVYSRLK